MARKPLISFLRLRASIETQLKIEEALFRAEQQRNWFIYNDGHLQKTIVMGISGKPEQLLHQDAVKRDGIPVLKRFSGGGTVIVDHNTIFTTFVCKHEDFPHVKPFPRDIMSWSQNFYSPLFARISLDHQKFSLREDDYVFNDRKCGGNAQSLSKGRWLHHTSFLWDFDPQNMEYLTNPARQPKYRQQRSHLEFLCSLKDMLKPECATREKFESELYQQLIHGFEIENVGLSDILPILKREHRKSTHFLEL
ncbi:lipoate protein ligase-like protein [Plasmopara halstedii]|uniref:Lipoate protein ligase-like protein n=1 Tax=Plasmopara halstedii TaxID=4781 RepID=A0A0P1AGL3_PLAHL|nr:lipoate protein ligase-like protein [Plasmopara halstedii]CEG39991.1 lipoate protein ligase-like protein [Plasmopara halstedii]|eukprot:XP_024576360.1 lipoate protein ligase-like protein [Plasmopara halstedii]